MVVDAEKIARAENEEFAMKRSKRVVTKSEPIPIGSKPKKRYLSEG